MSAHSDDHRLDPDGAVTADEVRQLIAETVGIEPHEVADDDDLVSLGLDSLRLLNLTNAWRKRGIKIHFSTLVLAPSVTAITAALNAAGRRRPASDRRPKPTPAPAAAADGEFGLATMQHAYWIGRDPGQNLGGVAAHLYAEFDGEAIDPDRLRIAVEALVERHPMLRAVMTDEGTQKIAATAPTVFHVVDLSDCDDGAVSQRLAQLREDKSHQRMDVAAGEVIDVSLTRLPGGRSRVHVDVDMLAADALSYRRVLDDLAALYRAGGDSAAAGLPAIDYTFREYLAQRHVDDATATTDRDWWAAKLPTLPDPATLPFVSETERAQPDRSIRLAQTFDAAAKDALIGAARSRGVTTAVAMATVFADVVARWSSEQRFLLNVPLFDRQQLHSDVDKVVGDFTNSLLIDADMRTDESLAARAQRLQTQLHTSAAHSSYTGLEVLRDLGRARGGAVTASVVFTSGLDLGEVFAPRVREVFGTPVWIISQGPQVDLDAQIVEYDGGFLVNWDIRRDALPADVAEIMFARFCATLRSLADAPSTWDDRVGDELPADQRAVRARVDASAAALPPRSLHGRFFDAAATNPDSIALIGRAGSAITYGELATRALAVAGSLTAAGVRPGKTVAVLLPKGADQIVAVLAVLAAGGHYLPISVDQPAARRDAIVRRGMVTAVLTDAGHGTDEPVAHVRVDSVPDTPLSQPQPVAPTELAYVLFTSGSTGTPKGVEVSHAAAANTIDAITAEFGIGAGDRTLAVSALDFDLSVFDIFAALSVGGAVAVVDESDRKDAVAWAELVESARVTVVNAAPGLVGMLADTATEAQLAGVRVVLTGGDRVPAALGRRLRAAVPGLRFAGLGGTTETAIHSTLCEVDDAWRAEESIVGYGVPLPGVVCRVVNASGQDCPDWVAGELWIGGAGVARGYRADPERTADRFVDHCGSRWYRTGDMARYRPDGRLDFLGRADHQVKVRGHRVELGEIEATAQRLPEVGAAVALLTDSGRLVLMVVAADSGIGGTAANSLRDNVYAHLDELLPAYMLPAEIIVVDEMPLTPNGKLDRAAVARLAGREEADEYVAAAEPVEGAVEYIAAAVLERDRLGVTADFFAAGGDSILATTLTARLRGLLAVPGFRVSDVFAGRTARGIAARLSAGTDAARVRAVAEIMLEVAGVDSRADEASETRPAVDVTA